MRQLLVAVIAVMLAGQAGAQAVPDETVWPKTRLSYSSAGTPAGGDSEQSLATQLSNPVSSLISVPFQLNWNQGIGDGNGTQTYMNIQPVIPISISEDWNLISRTILPLVSVSDLTPDFGTLNGLGNTTQSFFFSPKAPTKGGLIWGVGPVFNVPTATNGIAPNQWGAGITGVVLTQKHGWTLGMLANQIWSVNKEEQFGESSNMFLQPFISYSTKKATSITLNTESTYNWVDETWSVPINFTVGQIIKLGGKPVQITGGVRYWAESPDEAAEGWGARLVVTYLFPKG
jgi:hypothetical protein